MVGKNWIACAALAAAAFAPDVVKAQSQQDLLLPLPISDAALGGRFGRASPGVSSSSPLAFGPSFRDVFVGVGYQATSRYTDANDATASVGFGLGNAREAVGLEVVITSLSTVRSGLFDRTAVSFKMHHYLPGNAAVAVGLEGVKVAGTNFETTESLYGVISKAVELRDGGAVSTPFSLMTVNVGVGNGRFCAEETVNRVHRTSDCAANVFGSVGLRGNEYVGLIGDWTGQDLNLGISVAPFRKFPLVITPAIADVTGLAGDKVRFTVGAGFAMRF